MQLHSRSCAVGEIPPDPSKTSPKPLTAETASYASTTLSQSPPG
ncbi:putative formin-like protein 6 isoform X2 [Iris pallida]|uniref:Formin-like protein 6 isoform X2 n=1 Tax=Iris pallida TaxID=29817 RepID=A0AAX6HAL4_IRIPA|nr:putative formin-like protein 6 isoform X2 [Iris pallida]